MLKDVRLTVYTDILGNEMEEIGPESKWHEYIGSLSFISIIGASLNGK
jgi:hypothetical protein